MNRKKINKLIFISVLFVMGIFLTNEKVMGQKWSLVGKSPDNEEMYIDSTSIRKISSTSKRVWIKTISSPEEMIKFRDENKLSTIGYSSYSFTLDYYEIDCVEKSYLILSMSDYNQSGNVLYSVNFPNPEKQFIVPGSLFERVYNTTCPSKPQK